MRKIENDKIGINSRGRSKWHKNKEAKSIRKWQRRSLNKRNKRRSLGRGLILRIRMMSEHMNYEFV